MLKDIIIVCLLVGSCQSQEEQCCQIKTVGNVDYYFSSEGEVPSQCKSGCIYHEKNKPDSRYCFAHGNLPVICRNTGISVSEDFITSTNFPSPYENNIEASHSISVPKGHSLFITFIEFDLEYDKECSRDSLKIIDTRGKQLFFGCGNVYDTSVPSASEFPVVINTTTSVVITFKSDGFVTKQGFKLKHHTSGPCCSAKCETIDSILAPHSYGAQVKGSVWDDHSLKDFAYPFDHLAPTLVFRGPGSNKTLVVKWKELKCAFETSGNFDTLMTNISQFKGATKLVLVTHGWNSENIDKCEEEWVSTLAESISSNDQPELTATIAMCWNSKPLPEFLKIFHLKKRYLGEYCDASYLPGVQKLYYDFAASTAKVGEFLSKIITSAKKTFPIDYIHGLGHSLGAHVMGSIYSFGNLKINRISGMDPAGPCFEGSEGDINIKNGNKLWGLNKDSAHFVDNLHTDGDHYGTFISMGDTDFFAGTIGNARDQPTCQTLIGILLGCCHTIAIDYFNASIFDKTHWLTAYPTNLQGNDGTDTAPTIASEPNRNFLMHTGFWAKKRNTTQRMYTPIFKNSQDSKHWAAICNLADLIESHRIYCCKCCQEELSTSVAALC